MKNAEIHFADIFCTLIAAHTLSVVKWLGWADGFFGGIDLERRGPFNPATDPYSNFIIRPFGIKPPVEIHIELLSSCNYFCENVSASYISADMMLLIPSRKPLSLQFNYHNDKRLPIPLFKNRHSDTPDVVEFIKMATLLYPEMMK